MKKMILFMTVLSLLSGCAAGQSPAEGEKGSAPKVSGQGAAQGEKDSAPEVSGQGAAQGEKDSAPEAADRVGPILTEAPVFALTDEASAENILEIGPASYSWNFEDGSEMGAVIACGLSALDAAESGMISKLKVPDGAAYYSFSTEVAPDVLRIRQWNKASKGIEENAKAYHDEMPLLKLQAGKIYEFRLKWREENFARNRFYGTAEYFLEVE